jgi:hypothetical protein
MKKTIAKIMAAAMVLSTIAAPNAFAEDVLTNSGNYYDLYNNAVVNIRDFKIGNAELWANGVKQGSSSLDLSIKAVEAAKLLDYTTKTDPYWTTPANDNYTLAGETGGTTKVNKLVIGDVSTQKAKVTAATPVSAADTKTFDLISNPGAIGANNAYEAEAAIMEMIKNGVAKKANVNGEYNDLVVASDLSSWYRIQFNTANGVFTPQFNPAYAKFADWYAKMLNGGVISGTTGIYDQNGNLLLNWDVTVWLTDIGTTTDDYWNGIVKLKANSNRYTPIRVHFDYVDGAIAGANLGLFTTVVNGTRIQGITNWTTGALTIAELANKRIEILDVNSNDLAILKSDWAKGKNLMLDKVYVFSTTDAINDNGFYSAMTGYEDFVNLNVDWDLGTTAIGKIDTVHAALFKKCKFKYVDAQNAKFIKNGAFRECKQLKKARIGDEKNIKKINTKSFYKCKKLATVKLSGKQLKRVGKDAFKECKSNILFKIKGNATQVKKAAKMLLKQAPSKARYAKI